MYFLKRQVKDIENTFCKQKIGKCGVCAKETMTKFSITVHVDLAGVTCCPISLVRGLVSTLCFCERVQFSINIHGVRSVFAYGLPCQPCTWPWFTFMARAYMMKVIPETYVVRTKLPHTFNGPVSTLHFCDQV